MKTMITKLELLGGCRSSAHLEADLWADCDRVQMKAGGTGFWKGKMLELTVCSCACHVAESPDREQLLELIREHTPTDHVKGAVREPSGSIAGEPFTHPPV